MGETPACGSGVHCLGLTFGQASWHLARLLRADPRFGEEAGWHLAEALLFLSVPMAEELEPSQPFNVFDAQAAVLESLFGDGDLVSGVPLATPLFEAFDHHGWLLQPRSRPCGYGVAPEVLCMLSSAVFSASRRFRSVSPWYLL